MGNLISSLKKFLSKNKEKETQENNVNLPVVQNNSNNSDNNQGFNKFKSAADEFKAFLGEKVNSQSNVTPNVALEQQRKRKNLILNNEFSSENSNIENSNNNFYKYVTENSKYLEETEVAKQKKATELVENYKKGRFTTINNQGKTEIKKGTQIKPFLDKIEPTDNDVNRIGNTAINSIPLMIINTLNGLTVSQGQELLGVGIEGTKPIFYRDKNMEEKLNSGLTMSNIIKQPYLNKIEQNRENMHTEVGKSLNDLTPSLVQNATMIGISAINPTIGISQFGASAMGGYYDDGRAKGLSKEDAYKYGLVMTGFESATEKIINKNFLSGAGKFFGRGIAKETTKSAVKDFAVSGIENFVQEAIMEPLDEMTTNVVTGKSLTEDIDWEEMKPRMFNAGMNGLISSTILSGASIGIGSCIKSTNKLQKGQELSIDDINTNITDLKEAGIDVNEIGRQTMRNIVDNEIKEIEQKRQVGNKQTIKNFLGQKMEFNYSADENNTYFNKNIVPIEESMYNNAEVINNERFEENSIGKQGIFKESESEQIRDYSREEYRKWEESIKPIERNRVTETERKSIDSAKRNHNKDVILYDEEINSNTYIAGASENVKNKIIVSRQMANVFGLDRLIAHEIVESDIMFSESAKDTLEPTIDIIKQDSQFQKQKEKFWINQESNMPSDDLIAKDILCDRFSEIITKEKLDYDNVLSNATNSIIDNALINYYKEVYNEELEIPSSFNLQKEVNNKQIAPVKEEEKNIALVENNSLDNLVSEIDNQEKKTRAPLSENKKQEVKFEDITNVKIVDKRKKAHTIASFKEDIKDTKNKFVQGVVNKLHPIDKLAEKNNNLELKYMADKSQGASGIGQYNIGKAQTDLNGRRIGKSLNEVFEPIKNSKLEKEFSEYMYLKHNSDREAVNRPIFGEDISSQRSNELAKKYEERYPEFKKYAEDVYSYLKNETNLLVEAGMIDKGTADYLNEMYPNYVPVERVLDNKQNRKNDALTSGNGIKKATGGNADIMSIDEAIAARTMKLRRAITYNDLIKETAKTLKNVKIEDGQAPLAGDFDINSLFDSENAPVQEIDGKYKALYFEKGDGHQFEITKDLYEALKPSMVYDIENTLPLKAVQKASKLHRDMLTKFSLTFPIKNAIKDIQDVTLNSKYLSKFPKNYAKAIKEIATDGDLYNLYMANGGGNNTYFDYDTGIQKIKTKNPIKWSGEKISAINETIEQLPRLAEFISTLESGGSVNEALYNAADITTNFKRGGEIAKALNRNGVTFLNASIQGFDKFYRNFSGQNGVKGYINIMAKATLFAMAPAVLNHLLYDDDEDYQDLRNSDKDLYYLFKYDDGKFIRIPKGRALSVFGTAARRVLSSYQGEEDAFDGMLETISNQVAPNNPVTNNVIAPIVQATSNKSWFGGDIVSSRLQKELPKNQYDESTDDFSIWLGQKLNISPKKINYVIDQYSGGVGDVLLPVMTKKASNKGNVFKEQFTTDSVLKNKNVGKFYDVIEEQTKIVNDSNSTDNDKLQLMYLNDVNDEVSSLYKKKREVQLSNIDNKKKSEKVREIQDEINTKMKDALSDYKNVKKVDNDIAKVKNTTYIKVENKWKSLSNSDIEAMASMEKAGGKELDYLRFKIDNTYTDNDGKVKSKSNAEKIEYINNNISSSKSKKALYISTVGKEDKTYGKFNGDISTYLDYKIAVNKKKSKNGDKSLTNNEQIDVLLNSNFSNREIADLYEATLLSDSDDLYQVLKVSNINIKEYLRYKRQDLSADKEDDGTVKGKSVSGSAKKKKYDYINSMSISYEQKLLLLGSQYKLTNNERTKLANYINGMNLSKKQKLEVYGKLKGFTVYKDGRVTW